MMSQKSSKKKKDEANDKENNVRKKGKTMVADRTVGTG